MTIWRPPRTWRPGDVARNLTARVLNREWRDNLLYLYGKVTGAGVSTGIAVEPWTPVTTFYNGWTNYNPAYPPAAFYKHAERTYLRGMVDLGAVGAMFYLPPRCRPAAASYWAVRGTGLAMCFINVQPDGAIIFSSGTPWIDLSSIHVRSFDAMPAPQAAHVVGEWPLWEPVGPTAYDRSGKDEHGTYTNVTLGQPGLGSSPSAFFDGTTSYVTLPQALLNPNFSGAHGSIDGWIKVANAGVLTDATARRAISIRVSSAYAVYIRRTSANNTFELAYVANSITRSIPFTSTSTDWMHVCITWDAAANEIKGYVNGVQVGTTLTIPATWTGTLGACFIGAQTAGATLWSGWSARWRIWDIALTAAEVKTAAVRPT